MAASASCPVHCLWTQTSWNQFASPDVFWERQMAFSPGWESFLLGCQTAAKKYNILNAHYTANKRHTSMHIAPSRTLPSAVTRTLLNS